MDNFDDFYYDCFDEDFSDDVSGGIEDQLGDTCEGFWDLDTADFAIIAPHPPESVIIPNLLPFGTILCENVLK